MKLSEDTTRVLNLLDDYTDNNLRKRNDIGAIIEVCASTNNANLLNKLIFAGKSTWNLSQSNKQTEIKQESAELIQKEFMRSMNEVKSLLEKIVDYADNDLQARFETIYFQMSSGSIKNLIDLSYDLSKIKDLQSKRRK
jgi:cyclopropane fatty-acyl-phospholipid synthase-like methyltransferase